jgi:hypothetical protein
MQRPYSSPVQKARVRRDSTVRLVQHAEVVYQLGKLGIRGDVSLPNPAEKLEADLSRRLLSMDRRVDELAQSRSTDESRIEDLAALLRHWMTLGKPKNN